MRWASAVVCGVALCGCFQPVTEHIVGPSGGQLSFGGAALFIPPGALDDEVPISATPIDLPSDAPRARGQAFYFRPEHLTFNKPIEMYLRVDSSSAAEILTASSTEGPWTILPTQMVGGLARTNVTHFSVYYPSEPTLDGGIDGGLDAGLDAGLDTGFDAGRDAGVQDSGFVIDAGLSCLAACTAIGSACDRSGQCVFGYRRLRFIHPLEGAVVQRDDAGMISAVVELIPVAGLTPVPPESLYGRLHFVVSSFQTYVPVADGGPYVASARAYDPGGPYELLTGVGFPSFDTGDGGTLILQDIVHITIE